MAQQIKNPPTMQETQEMQVQFLGREGPLEKEMAPCSSILVYGQRILAGYSPKGHKESNMTKHTGIA